MKPLFGNWKEVACALALDGDDANIIAKGLMNGETRYTQEELEQLAAHKGMTVDDLHSYPEFDAYRTAEYERKRIAANMLKKGFSVELAAELTDMPMGNYSTPSKTAKQRDYAAGRLRLNRRFYCKNI